MLIRDWRLYCFTSVLQQALIYEAKISILTCENLMDASVINTRMQSGGDRGKSYCMVVAWADFERMGGLRALLLALPDQGDCHGPHGRTLLTSSLHRAEAAA